LALISTAEQAAEKVEDKQIPRSPSPRKRGSGRLGMTKGKDLAVRLKPHPFKAKSKSAFFPQPVKPVPFHRSRKPRTESRQL